MNSRQIMWAMISLLFIGIGSLLFYTVLQNEMNNKKVLTMQKEISALQTATVAIASTSKAAAISTEELENREVVLAKSQDQLLTTAVAKTAPAVVSIVISENAPKYEVTYENPFGDDPSFEGMGLRIPVYKQVGMQMQKVGAGSGIIFTSDGYILTNKHVVFDDTAQYTVLLSNGSRKIAKVVYKDPKNDVAVIKIDGTYDSVASIGDSSELKLGQTVAAIGNALGEYNNSVSVGIVSGLNRSITTADDNGKEETLTNIIQTDAAINPGNSGGPLIDLNGNVIGINVAMVEGASSVGFSIPINSVSSVLSNYK